ncbi:MAG: SDR family NAD(P)-dependent oxidoreductase [Thermoanaerobaculia bacterium]
MSDKTAVVTGASAGIGEATARGLAAAGYRVIAAARRLDRLEKLAAEIGGEARQLDVTDPPSLAALTAGIERLDLLVNNAGGALGLDPIEESDDERWRVMWETNVLGLMRMTRALLPALRASGAGHVINVGSVSGFEVYHGGAGYTSVKHATRAVTRTLRLELLGEPIRVTEINPGLVETEFALVRFGGDQAKADSLYTGMTPLTGDDVAECIVWAAARPAHVNIDEIVIRPLDQASVGHIHRGDG